MRSIAIGFWMFAAVTLANAQTVKLLNQSKPFTSLEVGNTFQIVIAGAAANGTVTFTLNGAGPFTAGTTDGSGNFSTTGTMGSSDVGSYSETWYVNGTAVTPSNPNANWIPFGPTLPNFTVFSNFTGTNCAGQSLATSSCGGSSTPKHWIYTPVTYNSISSTVSSTDVDNSATAWTNIQSKIAFSNYSTNRVDVFIYDSTTLPSSVLGEVFTQGQNCGVCLNKVDACTGACRNSDSVLMVQLELNASSISTLASNLGITTAATAQFVTAHELGHALRAGHSTSTDGKCSEVTDLMYPVGSPLYGCGVTAPTSCSGTAINTVYPSAPGSCAATVAPSCTSTTC